MERGKIEEEENEKTEQEKEEGTYLCCSAFFNDMVEFA